MLYEEKFLLELLLENKKFSNDELGKLNSEILVKIASAHLILPALYYHIKKSKYINAFPTEFIDYISEIYEINRARNNILIEEVKDIKALFKKNKLKIIFVKGAELITKNIFEDFGVRMVGDIDFLYQNKDKVQIITLLKSNGYKKNNEYRFWKTKHLRRFVNEDRLFALEAHHEILRLNKKNNLSSQEYKLLTKNRYYEALAKHTILNFQINDYGSLKAIKSLKTIYDFVNIISKFDFDIKKFKNKNFKKFFIILSEIGIMNFDINLNFFDKLFLIRYRLKIKNSIYYKIDNTICNIIIRTPVIFRQIIEYLFNKSYRKRVLKKIRN